MSSPASLGKEPPLVESSWSRRHWKAALIGLTLILGFALILRLALFVGCQGSDDLATWQLATALSEGLLKPELILQNPIATNRYGAAIPTAAIFAIFGNNESTLMIYPVLVSLIALAYVGYLLTRSRARVGRITALALSVVVAGVAWGVELPLAFYLIVHVGLIWLIRSLYFYSGVVPALMDLGLSALALTAAVWATLQSGSIFLTIWCFLLVQALHVVIPRSVDAAG